MAVLNWILMFVIGVVTHGVHGFVGTGIGAVFKKRGCVTHEGNPLGDGWGKHNGQPKSLYECKQLCAQNARCMSFTFSESGQKCHLKDKVVTEEGGCGDPTGWNFQTYYRDPNPPNNRQFILFKNAKNFEDANRDCRWKKGKGREGRLATWDNYVEWNRIVSLHQVAGSSRTWVGLTDKNRNGFYNEEGLWRWVDGGKCSGNCKNLVQWAPNEPNNQKSGGFFDEKDEDCAEIRTSFGNMLNDARCDDKLWFVCEFDGKGNEGDDYVSNSDAVPLLPQPDGPVAVPGSPSVFDFGVDPKGVAIVTLAAFNVIWTAIAVYYCSRCSQRDGVESYSKVVQFSENERVH